VSPLRLSLAFVLAAIGLTAVTAQERRVVGDVDPDIRAHVDAFATAIRGGSADDYERMAQAHFAPSLLAARSPAERRAMFERVRADFGAITIGRIRVTDGVTSVEARGATGLAGRFELTLEPSPPFRIVRLGVEVGDAEPESGAAPSIPLAPALAPEAMAQALDAHVRPLVAADAFAGVVLIARDGTPVVTRAYGLADREARRPATADLRYNLGSLNKLFTKVAIGQLVAAGRLAMTDTVGALLPDYPASPARAATVEQLLEHRGGIADFFGPAFDAAPKDRFQRNDDYYRFVAAQPVLFAPGARREYCNGCYIVLGAIVERVSGMPYEAYVAQHIFRKAGMTESGASATGYTRRAVGGGPPVPLHLNADHHGASGSAAGGGYASAADLLAFDTALRTGALLDPARTAWMLQTDRVEAGSVEAGRVGPGRARGGIGASGGAPGINAALESDGTWTIVVLANLDPPAAIGLAQTIRRALMR
jgi:CubicO group peptidase (beta-lactamase class C family)